MKLSTVIKFDVATINAPNLCDRFTDEDLDAIGVQAKEQYDIDWQSLETWRNRTSNAVSLAMQLQEDKSFPWPNCSNIKFPLVTIAAMQFHSRAYPAIVNGRSIVQCRVVGPDPDGRARIRADKLGRHMSYQRLEQDQGWEEDTDRSFLNIAIIGTGFKKSYYDATKQYNVSEFVQAVNLVTNYWGRSVEDNRTKSHDVPMFKNDIHAAALRGIYREALLDQAWYQGDAQINVQDTSYQARVDQRSGIRPAYNDSRAPFQFIEQHCWLDLDDDGYEEPYIVTFDYATSYVVRIVSRCDRIEDVEYTKNGRIISIKAREYFTKYEMIPSPDGGLYGIGFGHLLGPLNDSVNAAINQLFDAATLANTAGGFLGKGAKIKGGTYQFAPFAWNRVDSTGDDLNKSIVPLPVREPSGVMFNLLGLLIEYSNRVAGSTDMMVGENPGQNTPAETSRTMVEQGQKIYSAIYKRLWRSMKFEFQKLFELNAIYLPPTSKFGEEEIQQAEYTGGDTSIRPAADPTISSESARFAQAAMIKEAAGTTPGYDTDEVEINFLRAMGVDDIPRMFPGTKGQEKQPSEKIQIQQMKTQMDQMKLQFDQQKFQMTMQLDIALGNSQIAELEAKARLLDAQASTVPGKVNVEAFRAGIEAMREQNKAREGQLKAFQESMNVAGTLNPGTANSAIPGMAAAPGDTPLEQAAGGAM